MENITANTEDLKLEQDITFWINGVCACLVALIGIILNVVSIFIIWTRCEKSNIFYKMLISLLSLDICVLVAWQLMSLLIAFQLNSDIIVQMFPYFSYPSTQIAISASTFMTVAIAHERYLAVRDPLKYSQLMKTPNVQCQRLRIYLVIVIVISVLFNVPHFL